MRRSSTDGPKAKSMPALGEVDSIFRALAALVYPCESVVPPVPLSDMLFQCLRQFVARVLKVLFASLIS